MSSAEQQLEEALRKHLSAGTGQPWHKGSQWNKLAAPQHLNLRRLKNLQAPHRADNHKHKPVLRVDAVSATKDGYSKVKTPGWTELITTTTARGGPVAYNVATEGAWNVDLLGVCRQLCEERRVAEAVDALHLLLVQQQGCRVPQNLMNRVLKGCVQAKDLLLGRRVDALIVRSGHEGDEFLATQLIGLYAWHGKLEEAMGVFTRVQSPGVYTWGAITLAYAKHGEAAEAIRLYRQMWESRTVQPDDRVYAAVLKACAVAKDLAAGKEVHSHILASPGKADRFVQAGLVNMYAKCGSVEDARRLFDELADKNVVIWTAMISGYAQQQGMGEEALRLYRSMREEGLIPSCVTYGCLLRVCAGVGGVRGLEEGKQLHAQIEEHGLGEDRVLGVSLVNMYAKCGSLGDARSVFDKLPERNVMVWTMMIAGYAQQHGMAHEALALYRSMRHECLTPPDSVTYVCLLQACASVGAGAGLREGKQIHAEISQQGLLQKDPRGALGVSLLNMYAKCGSLDHSRKLFDKLSSSKGRDTAAAWNAMIAGYAQQGMGEEALRLYRSMQQDGITPSTVTYVCLLQACSSVGEGALDEGKQLHADITEKGLQADLVVSGSLVNMYAKCGSLDLARGLFDELPERNIVAWNAMIAGYARQGMGEEALDVYSRMRDDGGGVIPNAVTYVSVLHACTSVGVGALGLGKQLHAEIKEQGLLQEEDQEVLGGSLVGMYAKCGSLEDARSLFDKLAEKSVVAWTTMIAGYVSQGMGQEALALHRSMQEQQGLTTPPDRVTYVCLLQACASIGVGALDQGTQLHAGMKQQQQQGHLQEEDGLLGASLVDMYVKCGCLDAACSVFDSLAERNVAAWTSMIAGYARQGMVEEALRMYTRMRQQDGLTPDSVTYAVLLQACAAAAALSLGEQLHAEMDSSRGGVRTYGAVVGSALVNMYAKCGRMDASQRVFDSLSLSERSVEAWGALVYGYARQGDSQVVFDLLDRMGSEGVPPNGVTFLSALTVCSHAGLVDKGRHYFEAMMKSEHGSCATVEHYICIVDLLGRAGHLDEALQMARTMPFPATEAVWHTLLGACQKWKNVEIGRWAFECAVSLNEKDAASYVLMSNIYANATPESGGRLSKSVDG